MKYFIIGLILLTIPVLALSIRIEKSYGEQIKMLGDYNTHNFNTQLDFENFIEDYPNISVTTLPLATLKAEYFIREGKIDDAIRLFKKGIKANPYLGASEARLSEIYFTKKLDRDSAIFYAEKAYNYRPLNSKHFLVYLKSLAVRNEIDLLNESIKNNFRLLQKENLQDRYLPITMLYYLSTIYQYRLKNKSKYDSIAKDALKLFPKHRGIKLAANFIIYGKDSVQKALDLDQKAENFLENNNYKDSFNFYSKSVNYWPNHQYSLQKAGVTAYLSENFTKAIFYLEKLLEIDNPTGGITELYLYRSYKSLNDSLNACKYYNKLVKIKPNLINKKVKKCF